MASLEGIQECPFLCGRRFQDNEDYALVLHIEEEHTQDSPFVVHEDSDVVSSGVSSRQPPSAVEPQEPGKRFPAESMEQDPNSFAPPNHESEGSYRSSAPDLANDFEEEVDESAIDTDYVMCPEEGCGEMVLLFEFNEHLDLHAAEKSTFDEPRPSSSSTQASSSGKVQSSLSEHSSLAHLQNFSTSIPPALRHVLTTPHQSGESSERREEPRRLASSMPHGQVRTRAKFKRLGVSTFFALPTAGLSSTVCNIAPLTSNRKRISVRTLWRIRCPNGCTPKWHSTRESSGRMSSAETAESSPSSALKTRLLESCPCSPASVRSTLPLTKLGSVTLPLFRSPNIKTKAASVATVIHRWPYHGSKDPKHPAIRSFLTESPPSSNCKSGLRVPGTRASMLTHASKSES